MLTFVPALASLSLSVVHDHVSGVDPASFTVSLENDALSSRLVLTLRVRVAGAGAGYAAASWSQDSGFPCHKGRRTWMIVPLLSSLGTQVILEKDDLKLWP